MIFLKIGVGMLKIVGSTQAIFCVPQLHASAIPVPHLGAVAIKPFAPVVPHAHSGGVPVEFCGGREKALPAKASADSTPSETRVSFIKPPMARPAPQSPSSLDHQREIVYPTQYIVCVSRQKSTTHASAAIDQNRNDWRRIVTPRNAACPSGASCIRCVPLRCVMGGLTRNLGDRACGSVFFQTCRACTSFRGSVYERGGREFESLRARRLIKPRVLRRPLPPHRQRRGQLPIIYP